MNDRGSCLECRHLRMSHDISGWEAYCTVNSAKGRKITWQYGMDMDWCKRCVEGSLEKAPSWCPVKTQKDAPTVSGWVSVKDRLPDTEVRVLCCTRTAKGVRNIVIGYYMGGMWRCGMNSNVTHWMPLPEPPEVSENN